MVDVVIPPDRLTGVQSEPCARWLVENCAGSAIGHVEAGTLLIRFTRTEDAEAFSERWLRDTGGA